MTVVDEPEYDEDDEERTMKKRDETKAFPLELLQGSSPKLPEKNIGLGGVNVRPERLRALRPDVVDQRVEINSRARADQSNHRAPPRSRGLLADCWPSPACCRQEAQQADHMLQSSR